MPSSKFVPSAIGIRNSLRNQWSEHKTLDKEKRKNSKKAPIVSDRRNKFCKKKYNKIYFEHWQLLRSLPWTPPSSTLMLIKSCQDSVFSKRVLSKGVLARCREAVIDRDCKLLLLRKQSLVQGGRRLEKCGFHFLADLFPSLLLPKGEFPVDRQLMMI